MTMLAQIFQGTPAWVWILFIYLLWMGIRRLRPMTVSMKRVWLVPIIFIAWGLYGLAQRPVSPEEVAEYWAISAVVGLALGVVTSPRRLLVDRRNGLVRQPPSLAPLIRNITIFGAHYVLNVAMAINPDAKHSLVLWDIVVSGASTGYFAGWLALFMKRYYAAPETPLTQAAVPQSPN